MLVLLSPPKTEIEEEDIWLGNQNNHFSSDVITNIKDFAMRDLWMVPSRVFSPPATHMLEFLTLLLPQITPILIEELTDRSMGALTGRPYRETMQEFPRRNWLEWKRNYWVGPPGGESLLICLTVYLQCLELKYYRLSLQKM